MSKIQRFVTADRNFTYMRYIANILVLVGYYTLLNVDLSTGIIIRIISALMVTPWLAKNKVWDGLSVLGIMAAIDLHKLVEILFFWNILYTK